MVEQPENEQPEIPDANLRAAIDGLDDIGRILRQALADDDALAAGQPISADAAEDGQAR